MNRDRFISVVRSRWCPMQLEVFAAAPPTWQKALMDCIFAEHEDSLMEEHCPSYFNGYVGQFLSQVSVRRKVAAGEPWTEDDMFVKYNNDIDDKLSLFEVGYYYECGNMADFMAAEMELDPTDEDLEMICQFLDHFVA